MLFLLYFLVIFWIFYFFDLILKFCILLFLFSNLILIHLFLLIIILNTNMFHQINITLIRFINIIVIILTIILMINLQFLLTFITFNTSTCLPPIFITPFRKNSLHHSSLFPIFQCFVNSLEFATDCQLINFINLIEFTLFRIFRKNTIFW